jgi:peroxiredoxin 2/4
MSTEPRVPRILEQAPDFKAEWTHGLIQLSDYTSKGKYVLLFSHPSDFTSVCTTEFIEFARRADDFERLNVQLIGVSIDSVQSHIAWARDIERNAGVEVEFPVVATLESVRRRTNGGGAGLTVETWYLAKKQLAAAAN